MARPSYVASGTCLKLWHGRIEGDLDLVLIEKGSLTNLVNRGFLFSAGAYVSIELSAHGDAIVRGDSGEEMYYPVVEHDLSSDDVVIAMARYRLNKDFADYRSDWEKAYGILSPQALLFRAMSMSFLRRFRSLRLRSIVSAVA